MLATSLPPDPAGETLPAKRQKRNAADTRDRLLQAALDEFCERGYDGARVERIVKNANCNIRMAYHHFGDKEGLYLTVLEKIYGELRQKERELDLEHLDPVAGMRRLVEFTFDHMAAHPEFISLVRNENLLGGRMLRKSSKVTKEATPLVGMIRDLLRRGEKAGVFRKGVDPMQLYISILSLSYVHISNRHTLSILFEKDLASPEWLEERRAHSIEVIMAYLRVHCPPLQPVNQVSASQLADDGEVETGHLSPLFRKLEQRLMPDHPALLRGTGDFIASGQGSMRLAFKERHLITVKESSYNHSKKSPQLQQLWASL